MFPKNRNLNLSSQEGYRFVQISLGNRAGGTSLIISVSLNVKKEIIRRPASIPRWAFGEVFRLQDLGYGCRRIVRSLEEAGIFTTRSSVSRLLNG